MNSTICFLFFCWLAPGLVPDGAGGFVPFTNSRVMPDGSLRPYDPAIDGVPPAYDSPLSGYSPSGYPSLMPMPERPAAYYDPSPRQPDYRAPPRAGRHAGGKACYDDRGHFVGADNADCQPDLNQSPLPDTGDWKEPE